MTIKVLVNGANGRMGSTTVSSISQETDLQLVGQTQRGDNLATAIQQTGADVVIDFTTPQAVFENTKTIISNKARPVIGTTGLSLKQIKELEQQCQQQQLGAIIAPNFSIAAILMMKYAQDAAKYLSNVEIIEIHHPHKKDMPSGTALKTAELIAENKSTENINNDTHPAHGFLHKGIHIHALRLPGYHSKQTVNFGNASESLIIEHESKDPKAFMPGVFLSCRKVMELQQLIYGLDNVIG